MTASADGMVVILLGPPGVGKGTQGAMLAGGDSLHLSTGDLLRKHRKQGTELGRQAQAFMDRGELVPDHLILDMVSEVVQGLAAHAGVVFDGFPRTVAQADALVPVLEGQGRQVDWVVVLEADDDVIVRRLGGRRTCPSCGTVFNVHTNPPVREGLCDRCGAVLEHRADDQPETIRRRLEVYRLETEPLIRHYQGGRARIVFVNGEKSLDEVQAEIRSVLDMVGRPS